MTPRSKCAALSFAILVGAAAALVAPRAHAAEPDTSRELVVGTKEAPPFSFKDGKGNWTGISIDLWRRIATDLGVKFRFVETEDVSSLLQRVSTGEFDIAVAAITITPERARRVDFTLPYFRVRTGVAVRIDPAGGWRLVIRSLGSYSFLQAVLALLGLSFLAGLLIWLFERRINDSFSGNASRGISAGIWWSTTAMTQRTGGGVVPVTLPGRIVALIWMVVSVIAIAVFTAGLTSALTTRRLQGAFTHVADLAAAKVGVVRGTAEQEKLGQMRIPFELVSSVQQGFEELRGERLDAFVYDRPILAWLIRRGDARSVELADLTFGPQDYVIAIRDGSELRKRIDVALLENLQADWWKEDLIRYLGPNASSLAEER